MRMRHVVTLFAAVAAPMLVGASSCDTQTASGTPPPQTAARSAGSAPAAATPTATQPPSQAPSPTPSWVVGQTIPTESGAAFTVITYVDHFQSTDGYFSPDPGHFYAAVDVKTCAPPSGTLDANPYNWVLQEPDDSQLQPGFIVGGKEPELHDTTVRNGGCVSGWVNYSVSARPKAVLLTQSDLAWSLPPG